ncbi:MAG TPA: amylo-alpha-1,6-glucosidase [Stellaceae bacterium]|nr:amylo-alpha-1,6-glucosidase [Stellaceae bacterium]
MAAIPAEKHRAAPDPIADVPYYIQAPESMPERRPRTLKHGDTFAVFDHSGNVQSRRGHSEGVFHCDTRYLSHLTVTIGDAVPLLLSSSLRDDNATLTCDLANPDFRDSDDLPLRQDLIHIRRSKFLWQATCFERIAVRNFDDRRHRLRFTLEFAADFADLFEVRGSPRPRRGTLHPAVVQADTVVLAYTGLDDTRRETRLRFQPAPTRLDPEAAVFDLDLDARENAAIFIEIRCDAGAAERAPRELFGRSLRHARHALRHACSRAAAVQTSNEIFNEAARRAVSDLYMLMTDLPQGPVPYAGIPWFSTLFGRDSLLTALQTLWLDPAIACGVLANLAALQATEYDPAADAEPGKILHEARHGEMAILGEVPFRRYYGSVDATPLFVMLAGAYLDRTDDVALLRRYWPHIEAALAWIDKDGDRDGDGFVEYGRKTPTGLANQGWKDSHDAIFHADGALAEGPIALVEVQAYVYGARRAAAAIGRRLGHAARAAVLEAQAETLRRQFDAAFWDPELNTYVLALDGAKRPCRVRASNAGHALFTGIALPERARPVAEALTGSAMFSGWGIRTVATSERRYNPMSYHNGSVWPHDNALIALGFARYGLATEAARVFQGLFDASIYIELRRLPELFCGFSRERRQGPTFYPVACSPQAWAAVAPLCLLQACLGLGFDTADRSVTFNRPTLPPFLDEVVLRGLTLPTGVIDIMVQRAGEEVALHVLSRRGEIGVVMRS